MRIWVLGDSGTANADAAAVRDAYQTFTGGTHTDLWLMLGDNAYNNGTDAEHQAAIFDMYPAMLRTSALWPTRGNHEDAVGGTIPYYDIFTLPTQAATDGLSTGVDSGTEAYYSFDFGNVHFIVLDSDGTDRSIGGAMLTWLESDLIATSANPGSDWVIAFWHHPPYSKGTHNSDTEAQLIEMRENALPILEAYGVDLVLGGHSHNYERSYFLDGHYGVSSTYVAATHATDSGDGRVGGDGAYAKSAAGLSANAGAVYVVNGQSGNRGGGTFGLNHPAHYYATTTMGSVVLDIDGNTLDAVYLDDNGNQLDSFRIEKNPTGQVCASITLEAIADGYISDSAPGSNFGTAPTLLVDGQNPEASVLLRWDLSSIPAGATINAAAVYLNATNPSPDSYPLYQLLPGWMEPEATWLDFANGAGWQTPGAAGVSDRGQTALGATPGSNTSGNVEKIVLNGAGRQVITDWVDGVAVNHGLILQDYGASDGYQFDAREGTRAPRLSVDYCEAESPVDELVDLAVVKSATPQTVSAGDQLTYLITVSNNGPGEATGVVVTDSLPAGVTWVSTTPSQGPGCSAPSDVTCELGAIVNGGSATIQIVVQVNQGLGN